MFYSHEILVNPKHGVATVWLVANLGHNTNSRKLNRKAVEGVNVSRACDTIEKPPGAPIALRLQGSLLYGVSGVYHKHGMYLLDDTEKMWARMRTYFREVQHSAANAIDPSAGKARRNQLILVDDPSFVPNLILPPLDFDENGDLVLPGLDFSQRSKFFSQMSPLDHSSNSPANAPFINLNIRHSSSQGSVNLASPFDNGRQNEQDDGMFPGAFGEEQELPFADFPIQIDADGNLIEEPELPPHPSQLDGFDEPAKKDQGDVHFPDDEGMIVQGDEDVQMNFGDDEGQLPVMNVAHEQDIQQNNDVPLPSEEPLSSEPAVEQPQRQRKARKNKSLAPDAATHVSRAEFKNWTDNYLARTQEAQDAPLQVTTAQARKNAYNLLFGRGLGDIGDLNGIPGLDHELAQFFAGDNLKDIVMGDILAGAEEEGNQEEARGGRRRRSASVAFGSEDEAGEDGRRVRPRVDEGEQEQDPQVGRSHQDAQVDDDAAMIFHDDQAPLPEVGREHPGSALSDHRRSSNAPWNRPSSVVPSSARSGKHIEAGRNAVEQSPLVGRGSLLQQSDAKLSDGGVPVLGSDGLAPFGNDGTHDLSSFGDFGVAAGVSMQEASTSQFMREALDREGRNFLSFVERVAADRGEEDAREESLRWVEFSGLFEPQDSTRAVVAEAFLHVLTLATKSQIKVRQDGAEQKQPFGEIRIGAKSIPQDDLDDIDEDVGEGEAMEVIDDRDHEEGEE